jgi:hypothetical protein
MVVYFLNEFFLYISSFFLESGATNTNHRAIILSWWSAATKSHLQLLRIILEVCLSRTKKKKKSLACYVSRKEKLFYYLVLPFCKRRVISQKFKFIF